MVSQQKIIVSHFLSPLSIGLMKRRHGSTSIVICICITLLLCSLAVGIGVQRGNANGNGCKQALVKWGGRQTLMMMDRRRREIVKGQDNLWLSRRGGARHKSSFMGSLLRSWRSSASPVGKGGLIGRLKRFISALWNGSEGSTTGKSPISKKIKSSGSGSVAGTSKTQGRIDKHLQSSYRRGNANFRIQKVCQTNSFHYPSLMTDQLDADW